MSGGLFVRPGSAAQVRVREELLKASAWLREEGVPIGDFSGQLIRPLAAVSGLGGRTVEPAGFWQAALAVQLAHEASLVHDDIIDDATTRRGEPTLTLRHGVARALLRGDHLLTASYRAAAMAGGSAFFGLFARAVERTVAGEAAQGQARGIPIGWQRYEEIVLGKSGELLGCALAAGALLEGRPEAARIYELGRRVGLVYQMLDDLLDYCPGTATGKPTLADYRSGRWTWVLDECPLVTFGASEEQLLDALYRSPEGIAGMARAQKRMSLMGSSLRAELRVALSDDGVIGELIDSWVMRGREAIAREIELRSGPDRAPRTPPATPDARPDEEDRGEGLEISPVLRERVPALDGAGKYQAAHSRSFRFASRFFPSAERERVARVYAYCRIADDLVDRPAPGESPEAMLREWVELSRRAYAGNPTGLPLLDHTMQEMAASGVPFEYAADLVEGMRMDLQGERYETLEALRRYTYRVASVVGLWVTRLHGHHDPRLLQRAERMGHAMQLTNILRDVGEDLRGGRLYLPADHMRRHGVTEDDLRAALSGGPVPAGYPALIEELMSCAEADYAAGLDALRELPPAFARPVAVAAHVYRGIHAEIRRHHYDNLRRRAYTRPLAKALLAARALVEMRGARRPALAPYATAAGLLGEPQ